MGLGSYRAVSLKQAREKAAKLLSQRADGLEPIDTRRAERAQARAAQLQGITFTVCAEAFIADQAPAWKSAKHAAQWRAALATYAYPIRGELPVAQVERDQVLSVFQPIWHSKAETASRLRGRIESVLD